MRRITQIAVSPMRDGGHKVHALCNDGTVLVTSGEHWSPMSAIPQPKINSPEQAAFYARCYIENELTGDNRPAMPVALALRKVLDILEKGEL